MGYHVIDPADLEVEPDRPSDMRYVSEAAGLENLGLRIYDVDPGEEIPLSGLHYHGEQEEVFYVLDGTLSVETPERTYTVDSGQFFVAEPGSAHRAHNDADAAGPVRVVAMGAPPISDGHVYEGEGTGAASASRRAGRRARAGRGRRENARCCRTPLTKNGRTREPNV